MALTEEAEEEKGRDFSDRKTTQETILSMELQQNELEQVFFV